MNVRKEILALAIRILVSKTTLIREPDPFEKLFNDLLGRESFDRQIAATIDAELDRATATVKRVNIDRKFKKITENM